MEKITAWEVFFMLLAVIPVSKMLSSIFMKLVARVGTVDEDRWAMIGLGAIGATFGLMKKGGMLGGIGGISGGGGNPAPPTGNFAPPAPPVFPGGPGVSGTSPGSAGITGQSGATASSTGVAGQPGVSGFREQGYTYSYQNMAGGTTGQKYNQGGAVFNSVNTTTAVPPKGQRNLNDIINISGRTGNRAAGAAARFGAASSFAVPEAAPAVAGIYAATGKAAGGFTSTAYNLAGEIRARKENGQGFWQSMQDITGSQNNVAATTQVAMALAMSPVGSRVAAAGSQLAGRVMVQNTIGIKKNDSTIRH